MQERLLFGDVIGNNVLAPDIESYYKEESASYAKDLAHLEELYETHASRFYFIAYMVHRDPSRAEDSMQNAFVRLLEHFDQFRNVAREKRAFYLCVAIRNQSINDYHKNCRDRASRFSPLEPFLQSPVDVEEWSMHRAELERFRVGMALLPEKLRAPLLMRCEAGYPYKKIGEILGISDALARKRVQRAREFLRAHKV